MHNLWSGVFSCWNSSWKSYYNVVLTQFSFLDFRAFWVVEICNTFTLWIAQYHCHFPSIVTRRSKQFQESSSKIFSSYYFVNRTIRVRACRTIWPHVLYFYPIGDEQFRQNSIYWVFQIFLLLFHGATQFLVYTSILLSRLWIR